MSKARGNTSLLSIANRYVYIFNGMNSPSAQSCIEMIDLGKVDSSTYKAAKWELVSVANSDFVSNEPMACSILPDSNDILIFGGQSSTSYQFNILPVL